VDNSVDNLCISCEQRVNNCARTTHFNVLPLFFTTYPQAIFAHNQLNIKDILELSTDLFTTTTI